MLGQDGGLPPEVLYPILGAVVALAGVVVVAARTVVGAFKSTRDDQVEKINAVGAVVGTGTLSIREELGNLGKTISGLNDALGRLRDDVAENRRTLDTGLAAIDDRVKSIAMGLRDLQQDVHRHSATLDVVQKTLDSHESRLHDVEIRR